MRLLFCSVILACTALFLSACTQEDSVSSSGETTAKKGVYFEIISTSQGMTSYGCPKVDITVQNIGTRTGYNVACHVNAKSGNTIMDSGFAYFANGGNIDPGEKAMDEAIFFKLSSLVGMKLEYDLSWLER